MPATKEGIRVKTRTTVRKFEGDYDEYIRLYGKEEGARRFYAENKPYEERVVHGNVLLQEGILAMNNLITGGAETAFNNANANIGVGNDNTAAADTDTGLIGTNAYTGMEATYPIVGAAADKKVTYRSVFGSGVANFAWEEWTVANGSSNAADNMNRKVESLGTKSGGSWQLTVEISLA